MSAPGWADSPLPQGSDPSLGPRLTVVIPAVTSVENLRRTLDALTAQSGDVGLEIRVGCRIPVPPEARDSYPTVRWFDARPGSTIPEIRGQLLEEPLAPCVAVLEDHVTTPPGWAAQLAALIEEGWDVVAGPLANGADRRLSSRAAFLCEYHASLPVASPTPSAVLPGNNTGYRASRLLPLRGRLLAGEWEDTVHARLAAEGARMLLAPELCARHALDVSVVEYARDRYHYSRAWAGRRYYGARIALRMAAALGRVGLPAILLLRITREVLRRRSMWRELAVSLPYLAVFVVVWAFGEAVGALFGSGRSPSRIR